MIQIIQNEPEEEEADEVAKETNKKINKYVIIIFSSPLDSTCLHVHARCVQRQNEMSEEEEGNTVSKLCV